MKLFLLILICLVFNQIIWAEEELKLSGIFSVKEQTFQYLLYYKPIDQLKTIRLDIEKKHSYKATLVKRYKVDGISQWEAYLKVPDNQGKNIYFKIIKSKAGYYYEEHSVERPISSPKGSHIKLWCETIITAFSEYLETLNSDSVISARLKANKQAKIYMNQMRKLYDNSVLPILKPLELINHNSEVNHVGIRYLSTVDSEHRLWLGERLNTITDWIWFDLYEEMRFLSFYKAACKLECYIMNHDEIYDSGVQKKYRNMLHNFSLERARKVKLFEKAVIEFKQLEQRSLPEKTMEKLSVTLKKDRLTN